MKFKSDRQRKAVMANLNDGRSSSHSATAGGFREGDTGWVRIKWKDSRGMTWDTLMLASKKDHFIRNIKASGGIVYFAVKKGKDSDGDGVPDHKDCDPNDPTRQGWLHDQKMKFLKKREEKFETKREKLQARLEDAREEAAVKNRITQSKLKAKQAIIDETKREKEAIIKLKEQNKAAQAELDKYTFTGKLKRGLKATAKGTVYVSGRVARGAVIEARKLAEKKKAVRRSPARKKKAAPKVKYVYMKKKAAPKVKYVYVKKKSKKRKKSKEAQWSDYL